MKLFCCLILVMIMMMNYNQCYGETIECMDGNCQVNTPQFIESSLFSDVFVVFVESDEVSKSTPQYKIWSTINTFVDWFHTHSLHACIDFSTFEQNEVLNSRSFLYKNENNTCSSYFEPSVVHIEWHIVENEVHLASDTLLFEMVTSYQKNQVVEDFWKISEDEAHREFKVYTLPMYLHYLMLICDLPHSVHVWNDLVTLSNTKTLLDASEEISSVWDEHGFFLQDIPMPQYIGRALYQQIYPISAPTYNETSGQLITPATQDFSRLPSFSHLLSSTSDQSGAFVQMRNRENLLLSNSSPFTKVHANNLIPLLWHPESHIRSALTDDADGWRALSHQEKIQAIKVLLHDFAKRPPKGFRQAAKSCWMQVPNKYANMFSTNPLKIRTLCLFSTQPTFLANYVQQWIRFSNWNQFTD